MGLSRTVSEINGNKKSQIAKFSHFPSILWPADGVPLELGIGARSNKN